MLHDLVILDEKSRALFRGCVRLSELRAVRFDSKVAVASILAGTASREVVGIVCSSELRCAPGLAGRVYGTASGLNAADQEPRYP